MYIKLSQKWILGLNVGVKTIKCLEDNIRSNPCELHLGKEFLLCQ